MGEHALRCSLHFGALAPTNQTGSRLMRMSSVSWRQQNAICRRYHSRPAPLDPSDRIAISANYRSGSWPLNGLRHSVHGNMCGWYLWRGTEFLTDPDWFKPVCYHHLVDDGDAAVPYLLLPAGFRFLIAPDYEDVWFDESLILPEE